MSKKKSDLNDFIYLKPKLTFAMKLAASFALTYYVMMFIYYVIAVVFYRYSIDFYYLGKQSVYQNLYIDITVLAVGLTLSLLLVVSLILILCKKTYGKAIFVIASLILIVYQLITTSFHPWMKYALEVLMILVITPIRIKKRGLMTSPSTETHNEETSEEAESEEENTSETDTDENTVEENNSDESPETQDKQTAE